MSTWLPVLNQKYGLRPDPLVVCSSAGRCVDTSRLIFGAGARLLPCATLYDGTMQPGASALFDKLGYAPLRPYHDEEGGAALLQQYAEQAFAQIALLLDGAAAEDAAVDATSPWVICCHAIYTNQLCLALAEAMGLPAAAAAVPLDTNLQEADGFFVSDAVGVLRLGELGS